MARQRVDGKQSNVNQQNQAANTNAELPIEEKSFDRVMPQENQEKNREVKKIAMHILQDKWKGRFAAIFAVGRFANGTRGRIEKKCAVIGFAVVVTGGAKSQRTHQHQKRGKIG